MPRKIESHFIEGPAGRLEALLEEPELLPPLEACLVCHPHPLGGGTMHNKVVHRIARAMRLSGRVVLRFNFRGVGRSAGTHDGDTGEVEDAECALAWLRGRYASLPYSLAGFSFGSRVILKLGCAASSPGGCGAERLLAVGFPTLREQLPFLTSCTLPKIFVASTNDEFAPMQEFEDLFATFAEPKHLTFIPAADHFFAGALDDLEAAVTASISLFSNG